MNKKLANLSKKEWYLEHFDGYPAFTEMTGSGFTKKNSKNNVPVYSTNVCYYHDNQGDWMSLIDDHQIVGNAITKKYIKNKNLFKKKYSIWKKDFDLMMKKYYEYFEVDLKKISDEELRDWSRNIYDYYRNQISMPGFIDGFMFYADKRFDEIVREYCQENNIKNYIKIYTTLSAPIEQSFINKEQGDVEKITKLFSKFDFINKEKLQKKLVNKKINKILAKHLRKYSWIKSSYLGYKEYKINDLVKEIKSLVYKKEPNNKKVYLKNKLNKYKLFRKYKFIPEIIAIAEISGLLIKWQDERKIYSLTFASLQEKIIKELSRRFAIELKLLRYATTKEITKNKIDIKELKKRQKSALFIYKNGLIDEIFTGGDAVGFYESVSKFKTANTKEINGFTASLGKVVGKAKIVKSVKDVKKIKQGDILVAAMTRPEYLVGIKKAGAIVTDDGGITCHAAIVSRELGIPCIIGTKIATKIFKDNNTVEVDANNGIVKYIK